jgi:uncharacterized membrane protein YbaN (DUF454 family)
MVRGLLRTTCAAGPVDRDEGESPAYSLDIEIDEREGVLRIYDPRAFHAGRRGFCRRLVEAAAADPGFREGEIDLAAASCRMAFDRRSATARTMAEAVTTAIRRAAEGPSGADRPLRWRQPSRWSTFTTYRTPDGVSSWETLEAQPGRIRLRHEALSGDRSRLARVTESLAALDGIETCRVSPWSRTLTLEYRPESPIAHRLLDVVEQALRDGRSAGPATLQVAPTPRGDDAGIIAVATGYRRLKYLALAGGSFAMSVIGLIVPGIPTVPFLLATSYYLARSSPRLNDRLRRTALFGPILVEWEQYHGLSRSSKAKLMGLTTAIVVVSVALAAASPVILVVILVIGSLSLYGISRIPGLPHEAPDPLGPERPARLALPSP